MYEICSILINKIQTVDLEDKANRKAEAWIVERAWSQQQVFGQALYKSIGIEERLQKFLRTISGQG